MSFVLLGLLAHQVFCPMYRSFVPLGLLSYTSFVPLGLLSYRSFVPLGRLSCWVFCPIRSFVLCSVVPNTLLYLSSCLLCGVCVALCDISYVGITYTHFSHSRTSCTTGQLQKNSFENGKKKIYFSGDVCGGMATRHFIIAERF